MNKNMMSFQTLSVLALMLFSSACSIIPPNPTASNESDENLIGMPNPSAVYCDGLGYPQVAVERNGGLDADCILPDDSRCGAWDLLSGRCGQAFTYCEMQGGRIEEGASIGTCRFSDGSYCDEYLFFQGDCSPGDNPGEMDIGPTSTEDHTSSDVAVIEIRNFSEVRDFLAAYFLTQYGVEHNEPWMVTDIIPENAGPSSTFRYGSEPMIIVITVEASAPYVPMYTVDEVSLSPMVSTGKAH